MSGPVQEDFQQQNFQQEQCKLQPEISEEQSFHCVMSTQSRSGTQGRFCGAQESDVLLFVTSIGFDLSCYDMFGTLAAGGRKLVRSSFTLSRGIVNAGYFSELPPRLSCGGNCQGQAASLRLVIVEKGLLVVRQLQLSVSVVVKMAVCFCETGYKSTLWEVFVRFLNSFVDLTRRPSWWR